MDDLVITSADLDLVRRSVLGESTELCVVLVCSQTLRGDGRAKVLVREVVVPANEDYARRTEVEAELRPAFVAKLAKIAAQTQSSLVFVHSHPGTAAPEFSRIDDTGEEILARFFRHRTPGLLHLALVVSEGGYACRYLGARQYLRLISLGDDRNILFDPSQREDPSEVFDRQVRAFGRDGQNLLQGLSVGIVGLGGTGSLAAQQLVHLGVGQFLLVDPDLIEATNLNRLAGAAAADVGVPKVAVAERYIRSVQPRAIVTAIKEDVILVETAKKLRDVDVLFCCTDSHGSRAILQQVAYQYLIPCIDIGTVIAVNEGKVSHIAGRAQMLAPGLACLTCGGLLNGNEVRRDMMSEAERKQDPYLIGAREPAPAVMSINSTITSLGITMFLSAIVGVPSPARHLLYDGLRSRLRAVKGDPVQDCIVCSRAGVLARGDGLPIYGRYAEHGNP
ncbi:ThiF family adenylyltransferase (plasmid) [Bradyrhizobium sp. 62B]|uniref:HesA/MoeB/ThiF family protein n=1 Tax=Bradyrhizobium sp. 62B TaxID=2898442 RepID=UPI002557E35A|nr:ThiF family adenylyltransferase [Bradyrhizobium sp. 62B]